MKTSREGYPWTIIFVFISPGRMALAASGIWKTAECCRIAKGAATETGRGPAERVIECHVSSCMRQLPEFLPGEVEDARVWGNAMVLVISW